MTDDLKRLIPASDALEIILGAAKPLGAEQLPLRKAAGRILAQDLAALRTQPPFDASAMDGYAVRQEDVDQVPVTLEMIGQSRAGEPFDGELRDGQCVRIFTGAVIPDGADAIVIQENVEADGSAIKVLKAEVPGRYVRKAGLDFREGEILLKKGDPLTSHRLALAASMNHASVTVNRQPVVALLTTGDELVMPGEATGPGQIIASNSFGLASSIQNTCGRLLDFGIVADDRTVLRDALQSALAQGADLIVTTGGASVGDHDLVMPVAKETGFEFKIAKIAMRPGKPFLFATLKRAERTVYLTGLAGNPVSSLVAFNVFVKPLMQTLAGQDAETVSLQPAILGCDLPENDERAEYMRATLSSGPNGEKIATPFAKQDSSMLANLVRADCLVYRAVKAPAAKTGEPCEITLIE